MRRAVVFVEEFRKPGHPLPDLWWIEFLISARKSRISLLISVWWLESLTYEEAFKRIINYPTRGIGATTVNKVIDCARSQEVSLWEIISSPEHYGLAVNKGTLTKLDKFRLLISSFIERANQVDVYELGEAIIKESGISAEIFNGGKDADNIARQENLEEFLSGMQTFVEERKEEDRAEEIF